MILLIGCWVSVSLKIKETKIQFSNLKRKFVYCLFLFRYFNDDVSFDELELVNEIINNYFLTLTALIGIYRSVIYSSTIY